MSAKQAIVVAAFGLIVFSVACGFVGYLLGSIPPAPIIIRMQ